MPNIIEATSLSGLSVLAANPPQYPRNPTEIERPPLVLYIARVPGSQDVFLSPLKPRTRIVSAEDVATSLYYIHVDGPEEFMAAQMEANVEASIERDSYESPQVVSLPPRPLPPLPHELDGASTAVEVPALTNAFASQSLEDSVAGPRIHRKPLVSDSSPAMSYSSASQRHSTSAHPSEVYENPPVTQPQSSPRMNPSWYGIGTSLTLIRRDPASASQWNVARIHDPPGEEVLSSMPVSPPSSNIPRSTGGPLYLEVSNPGYSKFASARDSYTSDARNPLSPGSDSRSDRGGTTSFQRRMWLETPRPSSQHFGHRKTASSGHNLNVPMQVDERRLSESDGTRPSLDAVGRSTSSRGYTFMSPWKTRCEFVTGLSGRSLKCKHFLPAATSSELPESTTVSELRFSLPGAGALSSSLPKRPRYWRQWSSQSGNNHSDDEDEQIDLALGQELAGGGFSGRKAKLGKLIIENDGFKMLDLLVAANIALWWRAYQRTGSKSQSHSRSGSVA